MKIYLKRMKKIKGNNEYEQESKKKRNKKFTLDTHFKIELRR